MNGEPTEQMNNPTSDSMQGLVQYISHPLYNCKGWMKLLGVLYIITGVIQAITIFGIIFAWLPIWIGVLLFQSATAAEEAYYNGNEYELVKSLTKLKTFFIIFGILALLSIIFALLFVLFFIMTGTLFSFSGMRHM